MLGTWRRAVFCGSFTHLVGMRTQAECASTSLVADLGATGPLGNIASLLQIEHFAGCAFPFRHLKSEEEIRCEN